LVELRSGSLVDRRCVDDGRHQPLRRGRPLSLWTTSESVACRAKRQRRCRTHGLVYDRPPRATRKVKAISPDPKKTSWRFFVGVALRRGGVRGLVRALRAIALAAVVGLYPRSRLGRYIARRYKLREDQLAT